MDSKVCTKCLIDMKPMTKPGWYKCGNCEDVVEIPEEVRPLSSIVNFDDKKEDKQHL